MKRFLIFISTFMFFLGYAKADTYSNWQEQEINDPNLIVEKEIRYRYYTVQESGEFKRMGSDPYYEFEKLNTAYLEQNYGDWTDDVCVVTDEYVYNKNMFYPYQEVETSKFLVIDNISSSIKINKVIVKYNEINYELNASNCTDCEINEKVFRKGSSIIYDLPNYLDTSKITVAIDTDDKDINFKISLYHNMNPLLLTGEYSGNSNIREYKVNSSWLNESVTYTDMKYSTTALENDSFKIIYPRRNRCRKRYKYTYHYNLIKNYLKYNDEEYFTSIDNLDIKDKDKYIKEDTGKVFYRYLIKDNLDIKEDNSEEIVIDNDEIIYDIEYVSEDTTNNDNNNDNVLEEYVVDNLFPDSILDNYNENNDKSIIRKELDNSKTSIKDEYKVKKSSLPGIAIGGIILFLLLGSITCMKKNVD